MPNMDSCKEEKQNDKWKLREIGDVSNEENKRFRANLYILIPRYNF